MNQYFEEQKRKFWILSGLNEDNLVEFWAEQTYDQYQDVHGAAVRGDKNPSGEGRWAGSVRSWRYISFYWKLI